MLLIGPKLHVSIPIRNFPPKYTEMLGGTARDGDGVLTSSWQPLLHCTEQYCTPHGQPQSCYLLRRALQDICLSQICSREIKGLLELDGAIETHKTEG